MKEIRLASLRLENFKGIRDLAISFGGGVTEIRGRNATGKTTIYDAITWLLFGKDSFDRKSFEIKTRDANGDVIADIPHVVEGVLSVDGVEVTLRREYCEDWRKRRGTMTREMCGHVECRYYNGVPCNAREYSEKINGLCPEKWFKLLSVPSHFNTLKADERRSLLMEMAGESPIEDVVGDDADLRMLVQEMRGKTIEEYGKDLASRRKNLRAAMVDLPARIDERRRDTAALRALDFAALRASHDELSNSIRAREERLLDKSKEEEARQRERASLARAAGKARRDVCAIVQQVNEEVAGEMRRREQRVSALHDTLRTLATRMESLKSDLIFIDKDLSDSHAYREQLLAEWEGVKGAQPGAGDGGGYTCPTCGHVFDAVEYPRHEQAMRETYEGERKKRLAHLRRCSDDNDCRIDALTIRRKDTEAALALEQERHEATARELAGIEAMQPLSASAILEASDMHRDALKAVKEAEEAVAAFDARQGVDEAEVAARAALRASVEALREKLRDVDVKLSQEAVMRANDERIAEMEQAYKETAQQMCDVERMESLLAAFNRRRGELAEERINGLFQYTSYRLLERQVNGMDVDICEAEVGGVPYASLNSAMRTNCGLEIINAISRYLGVTAPTIIDNAEAVNEIVPTSGQQIRLYVTNDEQLTIINHD